MFNSRKKYSLFGITLGVLISITFIGANAAIVSPKAGQCYNYKWSDVSAPYAIKTPVSCTATHTAETYRVGKWPSDTAPESMDDQSAWDMANSICQPWIGTSKTFNYWAWYTPNPTQWAAGQRWIRCDAMKTLNSQAPYTFATFKKKMLDVK